ncbi:Osmotically-inducible protein OsmY, contains BON domain [Burkholderiales bacterium 8X]|nr:Osmotically-inducible protein OsmY, contains BON domain [Burkholderiales bacterium 8X]
MKTDAQIKIDVVAELTWDPTIDATRIGVIARDGVVTLTGHPTSLAEKHAAERAAMRVSGVRALAVEMSVQIPSAHERTDADIARTAELALEWNVLVPDDQIHPMVERGWVTLVGEVEWGYQRKAAEEAMRSLLGVVGITDHVVVKPRTQPADVRMKIQEALARQVEREAKKIDVQVEGSVVTLRGDVHSWAERSAAQGAAWSAPGVQSVVNDLRVTA